MMEGWRNCFLCVALKFLSVVYLCLFDQKTQNETAYEILNIKSSGKIGT